LDGPHTEEKALAHQKRKEVQDRDVKRLETILNEFQDKRFSKSKRKKITRIMERITPINSEIKLSIMEAFKIAHMSIIQADGEADVFFAKLKVS
jgi:hypothetical protein